MIQVNEGVKGVLGLCLWLKVVLTFEKWERKKRKTKELAYMFIVLV